MECHPGSHFAQSVLDEHEPYSHRGQNNDEISLSSPASSRAISIIELQWKIFQLVDGPTRKRTLLALALTCSSFTGVALDLLWRNLNDFTPLVGCFPSSLWKVVKRELIFQRAMTPEDWSIFRKYNCRVHSLQGTWLPYRIGLETWSILGCPPFPSPLLPNLTTLTWNTLSDTFSCIRLFMTQKLTTLDIHVPSTWLHSPSESSVQSILSNIPMLCPSLTHFRFTTPSSNSIDVSNALQHWSHLTSVKTRIISNTAILHLLNMPSLQELYLELYSPLTGVDTQELPQHLGFQSLRELSVECWGLPPLNAIFGRLSMAPKVLSIDILFNEGYSPLAFLASMSHISNACAHSTLEHLHIHVDDGNEKFGTPISAAAFQYLCPFHNLRKLEFCSDYDVTLDDATLLHMAKAWPVIEELAIYGGCKLTLRRVTANSFVSLLQYCPRLFSVTISVDWSAVESCDISPDVPYQGFIHNTLSRADFFSSTIHCVARVAAFLSAIAPKLEYVAGCNTIYHYPRPKYREYSDRWRTVRELVKAFSVVREQERRKMFNVGGVIQAGDDVRVGEKDAKVDI